jgi:hypothetical protein
MEQFFIAAAKQTTLLQDAAFFAKYDMKLVGPPLTA